MTDLQHAPDVRVGDAERAAASERLSAHAAAGRLSLDELEQRLQAAADAVFGRDLARLEADLPAPAAPERRRPTAAVRLVPVALLCLAIVASVLAGHPVLPPLFAALVAWRLLWRHPRRAIAPVAGWRT